LVVRGAFLIVRDYLVGFRGFLEALLGRLVARVLVRVVLDSQLAIRLLDVVLAGALLDAKDLVIISFSHG